MTKYLTTKEVAERYGVTPQAVRQWIDSGELRAEKSLIRGHWKISENALAEFEANRKAENLQA